LATFDHYFGAMPGVRGFGDPSVPKGRFYQPDSTNPDGYLLPFHTSTSDSSAQALPSNSHSWGPQHDSWDSGKMDGFVTAHLAAAYVANPDSDSVSVIDTATDSVIRTIALTGDPDTLALTPGGSEPQSGDGYEPTGIALVSTPTPGS
jgi:YVTN family beta-propeller protein